MLKTLSLYLASAIGLMRMFQSCRLWIPGLIFQNKGSFPLEMIFRNWMPPYTKEVPSIMAEIENSIAQCCKQLRLSTNFAGQALTLEGDTPQKYLLNLLENEISYRIEKRKSKYLNTAGFPRRYRA